MKQLLSVLLLTLCFVGTGQSALPTVDLVASATSQNTTLYGALTLGKDGALYGMSRNGGPNGYGTVYKVTPTGLSTLVEFTYDGPTNKGSWPHGNLICDADGNFYGMTNGGGTTGNGTVFKMTPAGALTTLVNFTGFSGPNVGSRPEGGLTLGDDGSFYGITSTGGQHGSGTIFKMTAAGALTTLAQFDSTYQNPRGSLTRGPDGNFYAMTSNGGSRGNIFRMTPDGAVTPVLTFTEGSGAHPYGSLTLGPDGALYGMTSSLGGGGWGTIFKVTTAGEFTTLYQFDWASGAQPSGRLTLGGDGSFYGLTSTGGTYSKGTIFQLTPTGTFTTLLHFEGVGAGPESGDGPGYTHFTAGTDGHLYATTANGGDNNRGAIIRLNIDAPPTTAPVIGIRGRNDTAIPHGHSQPNSNEGTAFGTRNATAGSANQTFTITNSGDANLTLSSNAVSVTGSDFTVTSPSSSTVLPAGNATFQITFDPTSPGSKTATVTIASNDATTPTYTFTVQGTGIDAPNATTAAATQVKGYSATINGTVNPNGASTSSYFQYSTSSNLTTGVTETSTQNLGSGFTSSATTANLSGLLPETTYYYRVRATNTEGERYSNISSFTTSYPLISGELLISAHDLSSNGAAYRPLPGVINNEGRILYQVLAHVGSGVPLVSAANDESLMSDASGSPRVILREGGQLSSGNYFFGLFNHILLGQSGQSFTSEKIAGATSTRDYAYLAVPAAGTSVDLISQEGDTAPDTGIFINSVGKPALDSQERFYFQGGLSGVTTTRATGVWYDNGEGLSPLVQAGENLTSITGDRAWLGKVSNILAAGGNGASFVAALQANPAKVKEKTAAARNQAIISANVGEEGVELSVIARKGDAVSGGSPLNSITAVSRGVNEHHAFIALMKTGTAGVTKATDQILATVVAGNPVIIAREGVTNLESGLKAKSFGNFHVTANGDVIFQAVLNGAPATSDGILCKWVAATRTLVKLAREGDVAPGTGGLTYGTIHTVGISDNGNVVLQTILSSGKHALHRNTGSGFVFVVKAGPTDTINFSGTPRPILSIGLYNKTTGTGGGGGGMGSAINDKGDVFTVLSIGGGNYITRIYRGQANPLPPS